MRLLFCMIFACFAAFSFMVSAADTKFDKDSLSSVREAAEQGDPEAQYYLGLHYEKAKALSEAVQWYRKAADQDDLDAQYRLGVCYEYEKGEGVRKDMKEAVKWYRKAADHGIAEAQFTLGECYEKGKGVERNGKEAVEWYRKAADRGIVEAQYRLGYCYENYGEVRNYDKAVIWYRRAAERENKAEAQYALGVIYEEGKGVEKDIKEAVRWYVKAAEQGFLDAQMKLGEYYESGKGGVPKNLEVAIKWYTKAADQGNSNAKNKVRSLTAQRNDSSENKWSNIPQEYVLGQEYEKKYDMAEAIKWYLKAAEKGYESAELYYKSGSFYEEGRGVRQDLGEAAKLYLKAAEKGYESAELFYKIGSFCEDGTGVKKDFAEAVKWNRKAAERGYFEAVEKQEWLEFLLKSEEYGQGKDVLPRTEYAMEYTISLPGGKNLKIVLVEAGSFVMSAKDGENRSGETPHRVTLKRDFFIGQTEVTYSQWDAVMGMGIARTKGGNLDLPVNVSWNNAMEFCEKLNKTKAPNGWKFILPTETQWEYAARGGKKSKGYKYSGSNNVAKVAWYSGSSGGSVHPVGMKMPNELGLYDMSGNVDEWCLDDWQDDSSRLKAEFMRGNDSGGGRVSRGGCYYNSADRCRSAARAHKGVGQSWGGFRIVLVPAP